MSSIEILQKSSWSKSVKHGQAVECSQRAGIAWMTGLLWSRAIPSQRPEPLGMSHIPR